MKILWDFDGTIFDTYPVYTRLLKQVLPPSVKEKDIFRQLKISESTALAAFQVNQEQAHRYHQLVLSCSSDAFEPFPFVEQVLASADQNVIMTHKSRASLMQILKHHGLDKYFSAYVTRDDGFPRKPDPASYIYLDEHHGFDLAVGDRTLDIIPAKKLGKKTCLFQNDAPGADFYLDRYDQFFDRVKL
ncbi:HAD-IA family hydrolase [Sporolactobacillus inulinus]|uniref:Phosphoglycolate phosphatase n=1 Tax=Sporolactobacillus inulinus CASD TaxID=1069536 RepID=A0A0U1QQ69_9BACL|nr:HAD-IA family hydrolase [Sporolactobacillus inulinus]KLI02951.1 phosphoglycolate phosphatase [Sporolactobacillus inulinus CASD]GEB76592.1 phosphoglycolate phosphatase [Sporolactobacillus inulinus]